MRKKKGFTLIEVIAVLVIISIVFVIVTPLVMSIIRKAKASADKRSIDAYGRSVEYAAVSYMLKDTEFPTSFDDLAIEYRGAKVECAVNIVNYDGSVFLDKCAVNGKLVKDSKFSSGYYQYGRDTGNYLFTLYKDVNEVINNTANTGNSNIQTNTETTNTSSTVTYNGVSYYRLSNVRVAAGYVALISDNPLSYQDTLSYAGNIPVTNVDGIGMVAYYTSDTCNTSDTSGCITDYANSNVKTILDAWAKDNLKDGSSATIMTIDYLTNQGYAQVGNGTYQKTSTTPNNLIKLGVDYWAIDGSGKVYKGSSTFAVTYPYDIAAIYPVIIAKESDVKNTPNNTSANSVTNNQNAQNPYTVDGIIMFIAIAVIVICTIIYVFYILIRKEKSNKQENN